MNNRIKGLIDIANEQIEILEEIQFEDALENNAVEVSREIRNWCEFIRVLELHKNIENKIQSK